MNNILKIVREQVLDLLNDLDASIVKHEGHKYTEFHKLSEYFGVNKSNASRNRQDYPNLSVQLEKNGRKICFIRIDFIWEKKIHRLFSDLNVEGEWFRGEKKLIDFIDEVSKQDTG